MPLLSGTLTGEFSFLLLDQLRRELDPVFLVDPDVELGAGEDGFLRQQPSVNVGAAAGRSLGRQFVDQTPGLSYGQRSVVDVGDVEAVEPDEIGLKRPVPLPEKVAEAQEFPSSTFMSEA